MTQESKRLDDLWRCPQCRGVLVRQPTALTCRGAACRLSFPLVDGIPVMLVDQATELLPEDWQAALGGSADARTQ